MAIGSMLTVLVASMSHPLMRNSVFRLLYILQGNLSLVGLTLSTLQSPFFHHFLPFHHFLLPVSTPHILPHHGHPFQRQTVAQGLYA
ncbi:hypothetical protein BDN71DRAFT_364982 [Pleurotus eryngii]|uniref:Uncharacterized protein n=1 Tax=Pleurotus eryngii TaxID=5323 RepID=A0A9P5ZKD9_PLEER|nr:hypothetical protein BDN71DRAFT_364982 [Pleurotus eryngii]